MKKILLLIFLFQFLSFFVTAQNPNDFYIAFSKSTGSDSLHIYISVQLHQNISYEVIDLQIKEKGTNNAQAFQISNRFPYGVVNGMNMYIYHIPYKTANGAIYEITVDNKRLCNIGPFKLEEEFSPDNMHTYSYANPGFKLVSPVKLKKS
jgi:hypothetical protein